MAAMGLSIFSTMSMKQRSLKRKLTWLILLPLAFEFALVIALVLLLFAADEDSSRIEAAKATQAACTEVVNVLYRAINSTFLFKVSKTNESPLVVINEAKSQLPRKVNTLKTLCKSDPDAYHAAEIIAVLSNRVIKTLDQLMADDSGLYEYVTVTNAISFDSSELAEQTRRIYASQAAIESYRKSHKDWQLIIIGALVGGLVLSVLASLGVLIYVYYDLVDRIRIMVDNTQLVASRTRLKDPVKGNDELTSLDHFIHVMDGKLRSAERTRQEFTSMLTHDMRAPLTQVLFTLGVLTEGRFENDAAKRKVMLQRLFPEVGRLERLIADLLSLDKMEAQELVLHKEKTKTLELIEKVRDALEIEALCSDRTIATVDNAGIEISVDLFQIERVLINLVANALKYSSDHSCVLLSCSRVENEVLFEVIDEGKGISDELKERIFERYEQGDQSQRWVGYGLGLHIAKVIVQAHNGRIGAKNRTDGKNGAIFYFALPLI